MVCRIRREDGQPNGFGFGCVVQPDGTYTILSESDFTLTPKEWWLSPATGRNYPLHWDLSVPGHDIAGRLVPLLENQEHTGDFVYWEGAMWLSDNSNGIEAGLGYGELTGY